MSFRNRIAAGVHLIREALRSPNYSPGVAGWTLERDGSAEFNDVVIRGDLESDNYDAGPPIVGWQLADTGSVRIGGDVKVQPRGSIPGIGNPVTTITLGDDGLGNLGMIVNTTDDFGWTETKIGAGTITLSDDTTTIAGILSIDGNNVELQTGGGTMKWPNDRVAARRTSNQSIPHNTATTVVFNTEDEDTAGIYNPATGVITFTAATAGLWTIDYGVRFAANGSGFRQAQIDYDGARGLDKDYPAGVVDPRFLSGSYTIRATDGATLRVLALQTSGGALNIETASNTTYLTATKVGV